MKLPIAIIAFSVALAGCDSKPKDAQKPQENVEVRVVTLPTETINVGEDYVADADEEENEQHD